MNGMKKTGRRAALAAVAVLVAGPAAAATGLSRYASDRIGPNLVSPKTATAYCEPNQVVVGGGAWAFEENDVGQVLLTQLQPIHGGRLDGYEASAEARPATPGEFALVPRPGDPGEWWLEAYALCADATALAGYEIVSHTEIVSNTTRPVSPPSVAAAAKCPSGKLVTGTGSRIFNSGGRVGLQLSRASDPLDISRSTARERTGGYSDDWVLASYAICASPAGLTAESTVITGTPGGDLSCSTPTHQVHSVGGGQSLDDPQPFFLQVLYPNSDKRGVRVFMTGLPPNGIAIQAICGPPEPG